MNKCFDCGLSLDPDHVPRVASGQLFHPTPSHCVSALRAEIAVIRQDAERYRWLRDQGEIGFARHSSTRIGHGYSPEEIDRSVDAHKARHDAARSAGGGA